MRHGRCQHCGGPYSAPPSHASRRKYCSRACYHASRSIVARGPNNPNWKGGRAIIDGRPCVYAPRHPRAMKRMGYVYESMLVAEAALGRRLKWFGPGNHASEVVHHINGDPADNTPSNLLICTERYHQWLHRVAMKSPQERHLKGKALAAARWRNHERRAGQA